MHEDIESSESGNRLLDASRRIGGLSAISHNHLATAASFLDRFFRGGSVRVIMTAIDGDVGSCSGQDNRRRGPDPFGATRDQTNFSAQFHFSVPQCFDQTIDRLIPG
jgi:hypothetical protein